MAFFNFCKIEIHYKDCSVVYISKYSRGCFEIVPAALHYATINISQSHEDRISHNFLEQYSVIAHSIVTCISRAARSAPSSDLNRGDVRRH